jgi:hypothetical protein
MSMETGGYIPQENSTFETVKPAQYDLRTLLEENDFTDLNLENGTVKMNETVVSIGDLARDYDISPGELSELLKEKVE